MPFPLERYELGDGQEDEVILSGRKPPARDQKTPPAKSKTPPADPQSVYKAALRLFRKAEYLACVNILDEYLVREQKDQSAVKLMAFALIHTGQYLEAKRYLARSLTYNRNDIETLNAMAYLDLSQGDLTAGINSLLDALYIEKENEKIKSNLEMLKGGKDPKVLFSMIQAKDFLFLELPQLPWMDEAAEKVFHFVRTPKFRLLAILALAAVILTVMIAAWPSITNWVENYRYTRGFGSGSYQNITIQDIDSLVAERQNYKITLEDEDINKKFALIKQNIEMGKRNRAILLMNEILHSNAPEQMKEHVRFYQSFIPDANPSAIDYNPQYRDVARAPFLYQDVFIKWNGTIANLQHRGKEETSFDLLIDFVNDAVVEGIAQPHFPGFVKIRAGEKVTVFGHIAGITLDNKVILKGTQIVPIGK